MSSPVTFQSHTYLINTTHFKLLCLPLFITPVLLFPSVCLSVCRSVLLSVCLCVCFTSLCCSFPLSPPRFDATGSWNFQPHNPRHQKFIEPGKQTRARGSNDTPTLPSLPLFLSPVPCLLSSFPRSISLSLCCPLSLLHHIYLPLSHLTFHLLPPFFSPHLFLFFFFFAPFHLSISPSVIVAIFSHRGRHATAVPSLPLPLSLVAV